LYWRPTGRADWPGRSAHCPWSSFISLTHRHAQSAGDTEVELLTGDIDTAGMKVPRFMPLVRCNCPRLHHVANSVLAWHACWPVLIWHLPLRCCICCMRPGSCAPRNTGMMADAGQGLQMCVQQRLSLITPQGTLLGFYKATSSQSRKDLPICAAHLAAILKAAVAASGAATHAVVQCRVSSKQRPPQLRNGHAGVEHVCPWYCARQDTAATRLAVSPCHGL